MRHLDDGQLQAWLDEPRAGLDAAARDAVATHLDRCDACARRLEALRAESERAAALLDTPVGAGAPPFDAIVARADAAAPGDPKRPPRRVRRPWAATGWAASIAVALGAGWMANDLLRRGPAADAVPPARPATATVRTDEAPAPSLESTELAAGDATAPPPVPAGPAARELERARIDAGTAAPDPVAETVDAAAPPAAVMSDRRAENEADAGARAGPIPLVQGTVVDATSGRPLESAQVIVPELQAGALTDADGRFRLLVDTVGAGVPVDSLTLSVDLIGYEGQRRALAAVDGPERDGLAFELAPAAIALEELVVAGADETPTDPPAPAQARRRQLPAAEIPVAAMDPGAPGWTPVARAAADARLGAAVPVVPDLEIERIDRGVVGEVELIRVTQILAGGDRLTLFVAPRFVVLAGSPADGAAAWSRVGDVWVAAAAPRTSDEIRALLDRLR